MRTHFRTIRGIALALTFGAVALHAGAITPTSTGFFNAAVQFSGFVPVQTTVAAGGAVLNLDGGAFLFDTSLVDAPGNTLGFAYNLPTPTSAVGVFLTLGAVAPDLSGILLNGVGAVAVPPVTDPVLSELLNPTQFAFALIASSIAGFDANTGNGTLVYSFAGGQATQATPEPGSLALLGGGVLLLVVKRRHKYSSDRN
jgi:hypothetical protein